MPAGVNLGTGSVATITVQTTDDGNAVILTPVTSASFAGDTGTDVVDNTANATGSFTVTEDGLDDPIDAADLTFVLTTALPTDTAYTITYSDDAGNFGLAMLNTGTSNQVTVTATVEPTLTFDLDTSAIALGVLAPGTTTTGAVVATTATNAQSGLVVSMDANGLSTGNTASDKHIGELVNSGSVATDASDTYEVESSTTTSATVLNSVNVAATQTVLTANNVADANAITTVTVKATAQATTEAGNYADTLTFSATATF